jgi:outer membrane lipoprotein SlyB
MVVSARTVDIQGSQSGVGTMAGTATGAVAGSAIGSSTRANVIGAIGGAVLGGVVGGAVEEGTTRQQGMEYVVETEDGSLLTIVQGIESPLREGDRVIVVYGARARVIADPSRN